MPRTFAESIQVATGWNGGTNPQGRMVHGPRGPAGQARLLRASPSANPVGTRARNDPNQNPIPTASPIRAARARRPAGGRRDPGRRRGRARRRTSRRSSPSSSRAAASSTPSRRSFSRTRSGRGPVHDDPAHRRPPRQPRGARSRRCATRSRSSRPSWRKKEAELKQAKDRLARLRAPQAARSGSCVSG